MRIDPDARLVVNRDRDLRTLPLTPEEFYLYSRVEALTGNSPPSVADVVAASGQPSEAATRSVGRLIELGALTTRPSERTASRSTTDDAARRRARRERALNRQRARLGAQLRANAEDGSPDTAPDESGVESDAPAGKSAGPTPQAASTSDKPHSILDRITPVPSTDSRVRQNHAIPVDHQRRLLAVRDRLREIGHFELLGLEPVDSEKAVRRAYHLVSRDFHPDTHYGKDLGEFRKVLDDLFRRARASYEILMDPEQRAVVLAPYEARRKAEAEAEAAKRRAEEAAAQAEAARKRAEAEEAARKQAEADARARAARAERDRERQRRSRERALNIRRKQAREKADAAQIELDAGNHGKAATLFRMAHEFDPTNAVYEGAWRETLAVARRKRAANYLAQGRELVLTGRNRDAARFFVEAANAEPTMQNLAEAAVVHADFDPETAHEFAMRALEALRRAKVQGVLIDDTTASQVHVSCARAFLAAGQMASAGEQAKLAHELAPTKQTRALLNSAKLA